MNTETAPTTELPAAWVNLISHLTEHAVRAGMQWLREQAPKSQHGALLAKFERDTRYKYPEHFVSPPRVGRIPLAPPTADRFLKESIAQRFLLVSPTKPTDLTALLGTDKSFTLETIYALAAQAGRSVAAEVVEDGAAGAVFLRMVIADAGARIEAAKR